MSRFEEQVCAKIRERAKVGKRKYGVTMERDDLNLHDWLTHLQEELMDAAVYVERLMEDVGILMTEIDGIVGEAFDKRNQSRD
jgi:hypothetical protein